MLDLVFINNQAPALNADNMNRIVNEINKTDAKANDLQSEISTLVIEKGGSIVQANPEEIPPEAEELNRLRINDKVYNISTAILNERITELDEKIDTDVSQLQDSIDAKVTQLTFETGIDIGDWEAVIDPDDPVIYERYMNYHDAVAKLSQQIDIMGNRTDALKTSLNDLSKYKKGDVYTFNNLFVAGGAGGGDGKTALFTIPVPKSPIGLTPTLVLTNFHKIEGWTDMTPSSVLLYDGNSISENAISFKAGFSTAVGTNNTSMNFRISGTITFS